MSLYHVKRFLFQTESNVEKQYNLLIPRKARTPRMSKTVSFKNNDRFIQIGIAIVTLRKLRGMSQEKLAEKAGISRSLLSVIEAPGTAHNFTLDVFFDIADALEVDPADLISASMIPDKMLKGRKS